MIEQNHLVLFYHLIQFLPETRLLSNPQSNLGFPLRSAQSPGDSAEPLRYASIYGGPDR